MQRLILAALAALALLMGAASAEAHVLSKSAARAAADRALTRWAYDHEGEHEYVTDVTVARSDCRRETVHRFGCVGEADFALEEGWEYPDGTTWSTCVAAITVRYARYSWRMLTRVNIADCV